MKDRIKELLPSGYPWRDRVQWFDSLGSTNDLAKELALQGAPQGTMIIAGHQSSGRGRIGRSFESPRDMGVYMSMILRPKCAAGQLMHLTCATAVAVCDAVERVAEFRPGIKWTNDIVYEKRKLAGILTELILDPKDGTVSAAILGIGINCGQRLADFDPSIQSFAGSLSMVAGKNISREAVAAAVAACIWQMDQSLLTDKDQWMNRYRKACITLNREVSLVRGDTVRHAFAVDVDADGALIVKKPDGQLETVNSGEVSVRGMYGYL